MAGLSLADISQTSGAPTSGVYPLVSFARVNEVFAIGGGAEYVKHSTDAAKNPGSSNWLIGIHSVMSFVLNVTNAQGSLVISLADNEGGTFYFYRALPLLLGINPLAGLRLPGWLAQVSVGSADVSDPTTITGMIKLEAR